MTTPQPENLSPAGTSLLNRRDFLRRSGTAFGGMALAGLLADDHLLGNPIRPEIDPDRPFSARKTHFPPRAKQVLVIYCTGAVSHVDTWEHKPELFRRHDTPMPGAVNTFQGENGNLIKPIRDFKPRGTCGKMTSDLLPELGSLADDIAFIHSLTSKTNTHGPGETFMSTGFTLEGFPSMGSWASYALGTENENLPAFVSIPDPRGNPQASINNWSNAFLPAQFQGTPFSASKKIRHLFPGEEFSGKTDIDGRRLLRRLNERHLEQYPGDSELAARIAGYELAARMQMSIPEVTDLAREPDSTFKLYGEDARKPGSFAANCLLARRLAEKGVRFIQLYHRGWDQHGNLPKLIKGQCMDVDQPTAALVKDLKQRGMLNSTMVTWSAEFGRTPLGENRNGRTAGTGRDHHPFCFSMAMAGGGLKGGQVYGATDEIGWNITEDPVHPNDLHATMLHQFGIDHKRLTYRFQGRDFRLTDVAGKVIPGWLA